MRPPPSMVLSSITVGNPRIWLLALKLKLVHHHRSFYVVDSSIRWTSCIRFLDEFCPDGSLALARASICTSVRSSICSTLRNGFLLHHAPRFAYSLSLLLLLLVYPPPQLLPLVYRLFALSLHIPTFVFCPCLFRCFTTSRIDQRPVCCILCVWMLLTPCSLFDRCSIAATPPALASLSALPPDLLFAP